MKVLFALNQNKENDIEEKILSHYIDTIGKAFNYSKEYDLDSVEKKMLLEKIDVLVLNEELEKDNLVTTSFIDGLVDRYPECRIILIIREDHREDTYVKRLFNIGIFDLVYPKDVSVSNLVNLINMARTRAEAKVYLNLHDNDDVIVENELTYIPEEQLRNILDYYSNIESQNYVSAYIHISSIYNESQMAYLVSNLPKDVIAVLQSNGIELPKFNENEKVQLPTQKDIIEKSTDESNQKGNRNESVLDSKVKESIFNRPKTITRTVTKTVTKYENIVLQNQNVIIVGLHRGAGTSFLVSCISSYISKKDIQTAMVEIPIPNKSPYLFDFIGVDKKLELWDEDNFISILKNIKKGKFSQVERVEKNKLVYSILDPRIENIESWTYLDTSSLLLVLNDIPIKVIDGDFVGDSLTNLINLHNTKVFLVTDCLPVNFNNSIEKVREFIGHENVYLIINKCNENMNKKDYLNALEGFNNIIFFPEVPFKNIYLSSYNNEFFTEKKENLELIEDSLLEIIYKFMDEKSIKKEIKKEKRSFFNLLRKRG